MHTENTHNGWFNRESIEHETPREREERIESSRIFYESKDAREKALDRRDYDEVRRCNSVMDKEFYRKL